MKNDNVIYPPRSHFIAIALVERQRDRVLQLSSEIMGFQGTDLLSTGDHVYIGNKVGAERWFHRRMQMELVKLNNREVNIEVHPDENKYGIEIVVREVTGPREIATDLLPNTPLEQVKVWKIFTSYASK